MEKFLALKAKKQALAQQNAEKEARYKEILGKGEDALRDSQDLAGNAHPTPQTAGKRGAPGETTDYLSELNRRADEDLEHIKNSTAEVQNTIMQLLGGDDKDVPCPPQRLTLLRHLDGPSTHRPLLSLRPATVEALGLPAMDDRALTAALTSGALASFLQRHAHSPQPQQGALEEALARLVAVTASPSSPDISEAAARAAEAILPALASPSRSLGPALFLDALKSLGFGPSTSADSPPTNPAPQPSTEQVRSLGRVVRVLGAAASLRCSWLTSDRKAPARLAALVVAMMNEASCLPIQPLASGAAVALLELLGTEANSWLEDTAREVLALVGPQYGALQQLTDRVPSVGGSQGIELMGRLGALGAKAVLEGASSAGKKRTEAGPLSSGAVPSLDALLALFGTEIKETLATASTATDESAPLNFWRLRAALLLIEVHVRSMYLRRGRDEEMAAGPLERFYGFVKKLDKALVSYAGNPRPSVRALRKTATWCLAEYNEMASLGY